MDVRKVLLIGRKGLSCTRGFTVAPGQRSCETPLYVCVLDVPYWCRTVDLGLFCCIDQLPECLIVL